MTAETAEASGSLLEYLPGFILTKLTTGIASWIFSLCLGAVIPLAFAPFNTYSSLFSYLIFLPLTLFLFQLLHAKTAKEAFFKGWLFGIGLFAIGVSWIYVAIHVYGAAHWSLAGTLTGLFIIFLALHYALMSWGLVKIRDSFSVSRNTLIVFYMPVAWVFFEWIRTWILTGFPWLLVGYPMIATPLSGYAPIIGIYGLSLLVLLLSSLFLLRIKTIYSVSLLLIIVIMGNILEQIDWSETQGQPLTVALIQGNVNQAVKWDRQQLQKTKQLYLSLSQEQFQKNDVIVWPENAIPVFYHDLENSFYRQLTLLASNTQTELITGLPVFDDDTRKYYNAMTNLGGHQGFYYKSHLVPFGEYVPLADLLRNLLHFFNMPMSAFSAGESEQPLLEIKGNKVLVTICYEDVFAQDVIRQIPQSQFMINLSNNGWYGDSFAPHQHLEMARMRALETSRELIRSTTSGISAVIDAKGNIKQKGPQFKTAIINGDIQPRTGTTPFVFWGNYPILMVFILAGLVLYQRR